LKHLQTSFSTYGFAKFYLSELLAGYVKKFVQHVRPWFFSSKGEVPLYGSSLFVNQAGGPLQDTGRYFIDTMQEYFNQRIEISTIRKVMETAVSDCNWLSDTDKDKLSNAMLHDPDTAKRYYIAKDSKAESISINEQWDKLYNHFSNIDVHPLVEAVEGGHGERLSSPAQQYIELIPTSSLHSPIASVSKVPLLVSEAPSLVSSPVREQQQTTREMALSIASQLNPKKQFHSPPLSPAKGFTRRVGDWFCDICFYDNFAYRLTCKNCNTKKGTKRPAEEDINQRPSKKINHDIVSVLDRGFNKEGEVIFKVNSQSKGITWVRAKHVPTEMHV